MNLMRLRSYLLFNGLFAYTCFIEQQALHNVMEQEKQ